MKLTEEQERIFKKWYEENLFQVRCTDECCPSDDRPDCYKPKMLEIFQLGISLASKPKKWVKSTDNPKPEPFRDIHMNIKGEGVIMNGYYTCGVFVDIKIFVSMTPNENLYWQYVDLPLPVGENE